LVTGFTTDVICDLRLGGVLGVMYSIRGVARWSQFGLPYPRCGLREVLKVGSGGEGVSGEARPNPTVPLCVCWARFFRVSVVSRRGCSRATLGLTSASGQGWCDRFDLPLVRLVRLGICRIVGNSMLVVPDRRVGACPPYSALAPRPVRLRIWPKRPGPQGTLVGAAHRRRRRVELQASKPSSAARLRDAASRHEEPQAALLARTSGHPIGQSACSLMCLAPIGWLLAILR